VYGGRRKENNQTLWGHARNGQLQETTGVDLHDQTKEGGSRILGTRRRNSGKRRSRVQINKLLQIGKPGEMVV